MADLRQTFKPEYAKPKQPSNLPESSYSGSLKIQRPNTGPSALPVCVPIRTSSSGEVAATI